MGPAAARDVPRAGFSNLSEVGVGVADIVGFAGGGSGSGDGGGDGDGGGGGDGGGSVDGGA